MSLKLIPLICLLWAGMVAGISFLESWVKFRTQSLPKPIGLDVGRTVFKMFHKVQNVIFILIMGLSISAQVLVTDWVIMFGLFLILSVQFLWLFPQLSYRVDVILSGIHPESSYVHLLYGITEIIKFLTLIFISIKFI